MVCYGIFWGGQFLVLLSCSAIQYRMNIALVSLPMIGNPDSEIR